MKNPEKTNINWKKNLKKHKKPWKKTSFEGFFNIILKKKKKKTQPTWFFSKKNTFLPTLTISELSQSTTANEP